MSKGAGIVERRIAELFAATRDRALSIDDIVDNAYALNGATPTPGAAIIGDAGSAPCPQTNARNL
jgi:hypothetical protein